MLQAGQPELIETIAKAGIASGVDGIFIETHHNPSQAKSDGKNMLKLDQLRTLIEKLIKLKMQFNCIYYFCIHFCSLKFWGRLDLTAI